ncbi:glycosyltransferase [Chryseobacterium sp. PBS4-4]|uniref:Glycosyltransferase n=1 Tax=Chryseobacterium edaphi TaxID=2976532 RepID=A0ABT2W804_9FLAO|nr:glycosyltransferase [Chryseobacterium edaphi]MCU7618343.1 glycosyltransferase [Chryseobacterium edaphi]
MKILFVQHKGFINGSGGTEKICSFLANKLSDLGHTMVIATNENVDGKPVFPLNDNVLVTNIFDENISQIEPKKTYNYKGFNPVKWVSYKIEKKLTKRENKSLIKKNGGLDEIFKLNLQNRSKAWKSYIDSLNPDIIVTMSISSLLEITFGNEYQIPIVNSTNGRPDYDYSDILWHRSPFEMDLLKNAYQKLSGIQILFESYKDFLPNTYYGKSNVIPNPVPQCLDNKLVNHKISKNKYKIINIASLATDCKQQHLAIESFAAVSGKFPNWELHFFGVGNDFNFLNEKIKQLNLQDKIFLNGFTETPVSELRDSDIFIFPSKYEGFPLALTEAMSVGLPSLGFVTCSGVNELIKHEENGFLAKDTDELTIYLEKLMQDAELRHNLGQNAHVVMKKYTPETISIEWEHFLKSFVS